jgi:spermidine synthase
MPDMKRALAFSFAVLGITSLIGQVMLIRELMIVFYGNEFFIGWILFAWFLWVGLGSLAAGKLGRPSAWSAQWLIGCHVAITVLLPASIFLARCSRLIVGTVPGEIPDLLPSLAYSLFALAPLCLLLGAQFVIAARTWESLNNRPKLDRILGEGYVYETLGFVIGGVLFGYFFVTTNEFRVISIVAWLNVIAAATIYALPLNRTLAIRIILVTVSVLSAMVFLLARPLNWKTAQLRFPAQRLVDSRNSIYGNLAVTETGRQFNFFENGLFLATDRDEMANEYAVHFPMLAHPNPKTILLIGNGFNGALVEILKHNPKHVDYVELDPEMIRMARAYISDEIDSAFRDSRVRVVFADGRFFMKERVAFCEAAYDVIIVNLPNPGTVLINRFYTTEFFAEAQSLLKPDGVFSTRLAFSPDYVSRELDNLGASVYQSLHAVFNHVAILPEYEIFYIASQQRPAVLNERLEQRGIQTRFATAQYIDYRLTTDRIPQVLKAFRENTSARINRDERPAACFYNLVYWVSSFHPQVARIAAKAGQASWVWMAVAAMLILVVILGARRSIAGGIPVLAMGVGSFSLMACEVVIILAFQVFYGYLYHRLSLIIAGLMFGMAMGTWAATHVLVREHRRSLPLIHGGIAAYCLLFIFVSRFLAMTPVKYSVAIELVFLLLAAAIGAFVGFEYPVANKLYLERCGGASRKAGVIYGVDLVGSCLGALFAGVWMLPVLGITGTMIVLIVLNAMVAVAARSNGPSPQPSPGGRGSPTTPSPHGRGPG